MFAMKVVAILCAIHVAFAGEAEENRKQMIMDFTCQSFEQVCADRNTIDADKAEKTVECLKKVMNVISNAFGT